MAGSFVRNSVINAVAGASVTLGGFLSSVAVARLLGVGGTGVVAYAAWAVTIAIIVADVGIPGTLARFLPEVRARDGQPEAAGLMRMLLRPFLLATAAVGSLFCGYAIYLLQSGTIAATWSLSPDSFQRSPLFWFLVSLSCVVQSLASFVGGWLQGLQRFAEYARLALIGSIVQIAATTGGTLAFGSAGALAGAALGSLVPAAALLSASMEGPPVPGELRRRVVRYTLNTWGGYIVGAFFATRMEVFFLERSWGSHAVGLFTVSLTLSNLATQGPLLLTGALLPHLAQRLGNGDEEATRVLYSTSLRIMALIVFPTCLGTAAIAPVLLPAIYGSSFADAVPSAIVLVAGAAITTCTSIAGAYANAAERTRFGLIVGLGGALLSLAAGLWLVPVAGPIGAAMCRVAIQTLIAIVTLQYLHRELGYQVPAGDLMRLALAATCCALAASAMVTLEPDLRGMGLAIPFGAAVYAFMLRLLGPLPPRDIERLGAILAFLPSRIQSAGRTGLNLIFGS